MFSPKGIPNTTGSQCYLNSLIQALVSLAPLLGHPPSSDIQKALIDFARGLPFNSTPFSKYIPQGPWDSHEVFINILDELPKHLFELTYIEDSPDSPDIVKLYYHDGITQNIDKYVTQTKTYTLLEHPSLLVILKKSDQPFYPIIQGYTLKSFINYLGGHYIAYAIRGGDMYCFDDFTFKKDESLPNNNTIMLMYRKGSI